MTGALDFMGKKKIPLMAFLRKCQGSGNRAQPVILAGYLLHYRCAYCGARFEVTEIQGMVTPDHEVAESQKN